MFWDRPAVPSLGAARSAILSANLGGHRSLAKGQGKMFEDKRDESPTGQSHFRNIGVKKQPMVTTSASAMAILL
jgi:hypothetical protein